MIKKLWIYLLLLISAIVITFPVLYAISASFMTTQEVNRGALIPSSFSLDNYIQAFKSVPLFHFLLNSFIVAFSVMVGQLIICSLAAYAIVFIPFKGRNFIFFLLISTMLIPWEAAFLPNYITVLNLGWINEYSGLTLPFFATAFGIFLLRQQFMTIPKELYESAQMDGCSRFRFYTKFALPLSKPILSALGIFSFLTTWNMYLWPLLVTNNNDVRTVQIGLKMMISAETGTAWNVVMAGVVLVLLPTLILLILGLSHLKRGLTQGALKG
ncbi:carbohydrate ABC transporter permease [Piscibacillus halophilus]|uniref:sn-glycerol 3-phosphate transport system permease protein n=1 Tax=Piscibacillus halophilus TaxID=571933 RepID=A0A1H9KDL9_9BACI|nr:carbohydrate ABC transporter permease [Piscibacillus halophilus]SEQ97199.1 sn-glycerol 3-phosphate transport system permease protein [Piscibacillus halophilus]